MEGPHPSSDPHHWVVQRVLQGPSAEHEAVLAYISMSCSPTPHLHSLAPLLALIPHPSGFSFLVSHPFMV